MGATACSPPCHPHPSQRQRQWGRLDNADANSSLFGAPAQTRLHLCRDVRQRRSPRHRWFATSRATGRPHRRLRLGQAWCHLEMTWGSSSSAIHIGTGQRSCGVRLRGTGRNSRWWPRNRGGDRGWTGGGVVVGGGRVAASFREALWQRVNGVALTPAAATATDRDVLLSTFARREREKKQVL